MNGRFVPFLTLLGLVLAVSACEGDNNPDTETLDPSSTSCGSLVAQILVQDGYFKDLCGCAEGQGTTFVQPSPMTCTVAVNTTIFFLYTGSELSHQIISTGTPSFPSSPLWDPVSRQTTNPVFGYQFQTAGTYTLTDALDGSMTGRLIVR
jgi:plastocyanin